MHVQPYSAALYLCIMPYSQSVRSYDMKFITTFLIHPWNDSTKIPRQPFNTSESELKKVMLDYRTYRLQFLMASERR